MSGKRQATSDLNHDNWDREEEPEERGIFRTATEDELKNRVIKKARRKIPTNADKDTTDTGSGTSKSLFSGFTGFQSRGPSSTATSGTASPFAFLTKIPSAVSATSAISSSPSSTKPTFSFGNAASSTSSSSVTTATTTGQAQAIKSNFSFGAGSATPTPITSTQGASKSFAYVTKIKALNVAVTEWIKTHVDKNPLCILTPIFADYEKHLGEIEREESQQSMKHAQNSFTFSSKASASSSTSTSISTAPATSKPFSFVATPASGGAVGTSTNSPFSGFSKPLAGESSGGKSNGFMNFQPSGVTKTTVATNTPTFTSVSTSTPSIFGNVKPTQSTEQADENDEDEPPKVEFKQVVEEDAIYSKKCKVFVKKDGNSYADCGVGTLYLKPVNDGAKTQLLVRADTNLGNILVNLILSEGIPAKRMGKNNVMMVCLPTPEYTKPASMLLRVKTGEDADELLAAIEKNKHK